MDRLGQWLWGKRFGVQPSKGKKKNGLEWLKNGSYKETQEETQANHENFQLSTTIYRNHRKSPHGLRLDIWASQELLPLRHVNITSSLCQRCHGKEKNTYNVVVCEATLHLPVPISGLPHFLSSLLHMPCALLVCLVSALTLSAMKCVLPISWDWPRNNTQFAFALMHFESWYFSSSVLMILSTNIKSVRANGRQSEKQHIPLTDDHIQKVQMVDCTNM